MSRLVIGAFGEGLLVVQLRITQGESKADQRDAEANARDGQQTLGVLVCIHDEPSSPRRAQRIGRSDGERIGICEHRQCAVDGAKALLEGAGQNLVHMAPETVLPRAEPML